MTRIFGLCTGDPSSASTFSGSARSLFRALDRRGALDGVADVDRDRGTPHWRVLGQAALLDRPSRVVRLFARWGARAVARRSERAAAILASRTDATSALLYGTDFFPAPAGQRARVPVGAAFDVTFAQLARAGEHAFGDLTPAENDEFVARQRGVFERCEWLFPRTEWCARSLVDDYGIARERIVVTGAGSNLDAPPPREGYDGRTILFVGRDWSRKGGELVLAAFRRARLRRTDLRLVIVGPRRPPLDEPGVEWLGSLDGAGRGRLPALYAQASLFVGPSRFEPYGIAYVEALAAGSPVVALDRGATSEIVHDGVHGSLLRQAEPEPLAEAILAWLSDPARLEKAGAAGIARARDVLTWDHAAARVADAFARGTRRGDDHERSVTLLPFAAGAAATARIDSRAH